MSTLWDINHSTTVHDILEHFAERNLPISPVATYMKLLLEKEYGLFQGERRKVKRRYIRLKWLAEYTRQAMAGVKKDFFCWFIAILVEFLCEGGKICLTKRLQICWVPLIMSRHQLLLRKENTMNDIFIYSVKSSLLLTMLYLPYMPDISLREVFPHRPAIILLSILNTFFSLVLPACNFSALAIVNEPVAEATKQVYIQFDYVKVVSNSSAQTTSPKSQLESFDWSILLPGILILGIVIMALVRLLQMTAYAYHDEAGLSVE